MEILKCRCGKELNTEMEIEYSQRINEFFCSPDCALDRYFNYMQSSCVDVTQPLPEDVQIVDGLLVRGAVEHTRTLDGLPAGHSEACPANRHDYYTAFLSYLYCPYCGKRLHS